jgi:hypothetical protein
VDELHVLANKLLCDYMLECPRIRLDQAAFNRYRNGFRAALRVQLFQDVPKQGKEIEATAR